VIWYEIQLPVYKQGDDLARAMNKHVGNVATAFLEQAWCYATAANTLSAIAHHPRAKELNIAAQSHSITVEGPRDLLEELAAKELIQRHEDDSDESTAVIEKRDDGWYYCDGSYPEEGYCGPFDTKDDAIANICEGGYTGYVVEGEREEDQAD
jgi:hypothetical protein